MPFGLAVVPDVYRMNSGCSASNGCASCSALAVSTVSCHHRSRPSGPRHVLSGPAHDEHVAHGRALGDRLVHRRLERGRRAAPVPAVGGDHDAGVLVLDAALERVDREAAEDDRVGGADAGAGQHRDRRLRNHRQVDGDPVARLHAQREQRVGRLADAAVQVGVGDGAGVARLALPVDGDPVAVAGGQMAVEAVVRDVELAPHEPLGERRVGPVQHLVPRLVPVQPVGLALPEAEPVGARGRVGVEPDVRLVRELGRRQEGTGLMQQVGQGLAHATRSFSTRVAPGSLLGSLLGSPTG